MEGSFAYEFPSSGSSAGSATPFGPPRLDEMADNSTPTELWISYLFRTVKAQTSIAGEQNRHISELEHSKKQLIHLHETPLPPGNRRGRSPHRPRFRSPWSSISVRSPSRGQRSPRWRSPRRYPPRRSPPKRSPPRRNRCSWSSSSSRSDDERDARGDWYAYGPFTRRIGETPIPCGLDKPLKMKSYDWTSDLDEHIENIEAVLTYHSVQGAVKCKLFLTTLRWGAMI